MKGMPFAMVLIASLGAALFFGYRGSKREASVQNSSESGSQVFEVKGRLKSIASDSRSAVIEHEAIPDYMPAMTMAFAVKDPAALAGLEDGNAISFRFIVTDDDSWIEQVKKLRDDTVSQSPAGDRTSGVGSSGSVATLNVGDPVPDFQLTNQEGEQFQLKDLAGKQVVLTFIFVRCPVPNYCPLMSENFRKLQEMLKASDKMEDVRLLSITIDPTYDTPEVLKAYASRYTQNLEQWIFATGGEKQISDLLAQFTVYAEPKGETITHELVTAYISPDGRLAQVWRGNGWKPQDVLDALRTQASHDVNRKN